VSGTVIAFIISNLYIVYKEIKMLTDAQEKTVVSGSYATQRAYTVEEVFEHIDKRLVEAFGEDFKDRLSQEKAKRNLF